MRLRAAVPIVLSAVLWGGSPLPAEIVERVIARVNGEIVSQSEFESRQVAAVQAARIPAERVETFLRENNARLLQEAIDELLLSQRAAELGIRLRGEYVDEVIEGIKKENNLPSDEALRAQLRKEGMTLGDLRRNIERSVLRRQVLARELEPKAKVTEADARAEYERNVADYRLPAAVRLQEILVADAARAAEVVSLAKAGGDFAALAKERSAAPTAASGGELGWLNRGDLSRELEGAIFALPAGGVSAPIETEAGHRVFKVVEKREARTVKFEEAREEILRRLTQDRMAREYEAYMEGLRKAAMIDLRVREVPLQVELPAEPVVTRPAPGAPEPEFSVSPQERPERVAPPVVPAAPSPVPSPQPSPAP